MALTTPLSEEIPRLKGQCAPIMLRRCGPFWSHVYNAFFKPPLGPNAADFLLEAPHAPLSEVERQNDVFALLELMANAGASTHRVERLGGALCNVMGFADHQVAVLPSLLTVSFNGTSSTQVTRTLTVIVAPSLSLSAMETIDYLVLSLIEGRLPPVALADVVRVARDLKPVFPLWAVLLSVAVCNGACAAAFFATDWHGVWISTVIG